MKGLLAVLLIMFSVNEVLAQAAGRWNIVSESQERVYTRAEFERLQDDYPQYFDRYDASMVASASILFRKYRYFGPTMCEKNDPRLTYNYVSYSACYLQQFGGGCSGFNAHLPRPHDPCF